MTTLYIILGLLVVLAIIAIIYDGLDGLLFFLKIIFILTLIIVFFGFISYNEELENYKSDVAKYNNGICSECGGNYEYKQAVGTNSDTGYIYICDNCKNLIQLDNYLRIDDYGKTK